jgi:hypothetical protein
MRSKGVASIAAPSTPFRNFPDMTQSFPLARIALVGSAASLFITAAALAAPSPSGVANARTGTPLERQDTVSHDNDRLAQAGTSTAGLSSSGGSGAIALADLKALVPAKVGAWRRQSLSQVTPGPLGGRSGETAEARFGKGKQQAMLTVSDLGAPPTGAALGQQRIGAPVDQATDTGTEKVYVEGGHTVREEFVRDTKLSRVTVILDNGIVVGASGTGVDAVALKALAMGVDLARAQALARPAK